MKRNAKCFIAAVALTLIASPAVAQMIDVRDEASVDVPRGFFGASEPALALKQEARDNAIANAWRRYQAQNLSGARAELFAKHKDAIHQQVKALCSFTPYEERFDKEAATFSVKVRGSCDQGAVDAFAKKLAGDPVVEGMEGEKLSIVIMFLARRAEESTSVQDVKVDSVTQADGTQSKGVTVQRDTVYRYKGEQSENMDNAVTHSLTTGGYNVVRYSDLPGTCSGSGPSLDEVMPTFTAQWRNQAELIPAGLRERMIKSAKDCEMSFFGVGLLDIFKSEYKSDGSVGVTVALTIDIRDIRKKVPVAVAVIPVTQYHAIGHDRIEAANAALKKAADYGAREIVDMLRQRGIR